MIYPAKTFDFPKVPFVFIRHGETDANKAEIIAGSSEPPLNNAGREQARAIAPLMAMGKWQAVYVSPQDRARKTAELVLPDYELHILDGLRERHWGDLEGRPISEVCSRFDTPPNGEGFDAMCQRVSFAMQTALAEVSDRLTVVVAHSGVGRCILYMTGFDAEGPRIANATPILFRPTAMGWGYENLTEDLIREISA
ncbi:MULTISPECIES: histidine phosphatase family protein [Thalassospira]|uniref:histidine phosphatase family protein n=1 Tax=Thalassospira TaxID=168934 RepID=UPI000C440082|nr:MULTISPECIES: histidine phosphatase family protein [Thalassospira]MAZ34223.1 phosphoglycerate mutase [Thalassospira sp.]WOI11062.1 histidine phosphatase family protein [Thalassospira lucentensis]